MKQTTFILFITWLFHLCAYAQQTDLLASARDLPNKQFLRSDVLKLNELTDDQFLERMQYDYARQCLLEHDSICTVENDGIRINLLCVAAHNGWLTRKEAAQHVLRYLMDFKNAKTIQGIMPRTFNRQTGEQAKVKYGTFGKPYDVVGAAFMAISLRYVVQTFFDKPTNDEIQIRKVCDEICNRINWDFAYNKNQKCFTWFKNGSDASRFDGKELKGEMDETFFLQLFVLGEKNWSHGTEALEEYLQNVFVDKQYGYTFYGTKEYNYKETGNLSYMTIHNSAVQKMKDYPMAKLGYLVQPHIWFDLRKHTDAFCKRHQVNYFESVQHAILAQIKYAKQNLGHFPLYGDVWGFYDTYSPALSKGIIKGLPAEGDYDEGTISIDAVMSAVPFLPKESIACLRTLYKNFKNNNVYSSRGWVTSVNTPTGNVAPFFWDGFYPPLDVLLIENYRSGLLWKCAAKSPAYQKALQKSLSIN